ncbi:MAG: hypothetical protein AMK75_04620, partial [Planctomycetes bacterium SM23_65]
MKTKWGRVLLLAAAVAASAVTSAEEPVIHPQHPRLYFRKEDLSWIRRRCATTHRTWYQQMKSWNAERAELSGGSGEELAMMYQITGDDRYVPVALTASRMAPAPGVYDLLYEALSPEERKRYGRRLLPGKRNLGGNEGSMYFYTCASGDRALALYGDGVAEDETEREAL